MEVTGLRSQTGQVFVNPDGTRTLRQHVRPIHAQRGEEWVPVDTALHKRADGTVAPAVTAVEMAFSGGGSAPLLRMSTGNKELALTWPKPLPAPHLDADTATYPEVLPGVDMRIRADVDGYSQVLVVKNPQAARNPELATLRYGVTGKGVTINVADAGDLSAKDATGTEVFHAPIPKMWDSAGTRAGTPTPVSGPADGARQVPIRAHAEGGHLALVPDAALLTDPKTTFPVYIDPSFTASRLAWTQVYKKYPDSPHWNENDLAKVGYEGSQGNIVRPFFRLDTAPVNGKHILQATFGIHEVHAWSCQPRPLQLGLTDPINPGTSWNNQPVWHETLGEVNVAKGYNSSCPAGGVEFDVTGVVQRAAEEGWLDLTLGLRANESDKFAWKKFDNNPFVSIVYNTFPTAPASLSTVPPTRCGKGDERSLLNTTTPTLSAVLSDDDGNDVLGQLEILKADQVIHSVETDPVTSGSTFSWPKIPANLLQQGVTYTYRARAFDGTDWGSYTTACEIEIDTSKPNSPTVRSIDFPSDGEGKRVGTPGLVTFSSDAGDKVASFVYGFDQGRLSNSVSAKADGTATVPITLLHSAPTFLYVQTKDAAGNVSAGPAAYRMRAAKREGPSPHVRGDFNGDAKADISYLVDNGDNRTTAINHISTGDGFHGPVVSWDTGINGGYPTDRLKTARGDFDGDGRTDTAVFREESGTRNTLTVLKSDGNAYASSPVVWDNSSGPGALPLTKVVAGDFDGDGRDDLVQLFDLGDDKLATWMSLSTSTPDELSFAAPMDWLHTRKGSFNWSQIKLVVGDFNNDGMDDLAEFYGYSASLTRQWTYLSTGSSFIPMALQWNSPGGLAWTSGTFIAGDVTGDGKDDIVVMRDYGEAETRLLALISTDTGWSSWTPWWHSGGKNTFDSARVSLHAGDYNGDRKTDIATVEEINGNRKRVHTFISTGTAFNNPKKQESRDGAITPTSNR